MWLVMNIGCIECDVSSKVVGVFADKARAQTPKPQPEQSGCKPKPGANPGCTL